MDDKDMARDLKHWPFKVANKGGKPAISVKHKGEKKEFVRASPFTSSHHRLMFFSES